MRRSLLLALAIAVVGCGGNREPGTGSAERSAPLISAPDSTAPEASPSEAADPIETGMSATADAVIQAFKAAGLEAENPSAMAQSEYGIVPNRCEGTEFDIPSAETDSPDGYILVCVSDLVADSIATTRAMLGRADERYATRVLRNEAAGAVLLLPGPSQMDDATAAQYEAALATVGQ